MSTFACCQTDDQTGVVFSRMRGTFVLRKAAFFSKRAPARHARHTRPNTHPHRHLSEARSSRRSGPGSRWTPEIGTCTHVLRRTRRGITSDRIMTLQCVIDDYSSRGLGTRLPVTHTTLDQAVDNPSPPLPLHARRCTAKPRRFLHAFPHWLHVTPAS